MSQRKSIGLMAGMALAGISIGAMRASAAPSSKSSVGSTRWISKQQAAKPPHCPLRPGQDWSEAEDQKEATRYRHAILDGIFNQWVELGRAPTPAEFAQRMKLTQPEADRLLDEMQACGESTEAGILRAPTSELIAIAWPLANIPTGILSFFSSKEAGEKWQKEHDGEGTLFTLANAVKHGADIFGSYSEGLQ